MEQQDTFRYTYSAKEQEEVKRLREKYAPQPVAVEDKLAALRRLDEGVTQKAMAFSLTLGIIGTLIMGTGMCCVLVWSQMLIGIPVGLLGILGVVLAYPLYNRILKTERARIAPEVLRLTDELLK
ncbi:MAG: hypothetical protein IJ465_03815 [Clostridia bacterium]|nr:hypothetical protein [Clostridia bacterium]